MTADDLRILSIDGGGIKGILPAAVLAECERRFLKGGSAASYFDMIAGTSTGGIIALGMAAGMRAEEVLEIYMRHGSEIFPRPWSPPTRFGRAMRSAYQFARDLAVYRYNREPLERALRDRFGNRTLGSVNVRLNIPAFDGFNEVNVLKTPHHPDFRLDWQEELVTVALATSAAPTFFSTYRNGTRHFADGGAWANNPVMVALVDAMSCFNVDRHKIEILEPWLWRSRPSYDRRSDQARRHVPLENNHRERDAPAKPERPRTGRTFDRARPHASFDIRSDARTHRT